MSQKYSITSGNSSNNRRKSVFTPHLNNSNINEALAQAIELERIEQEITLTLQSVDKSFAKSHKIINDKLIPIVKKYHTNSKKIWSGVNFWKTFLETSANVELKGYEEAVENQGDLDASLQHNNEYNQLPSDETIRDSNEQMSPVKVNAVSSVGDDILMESTNHTQQQFQQRYTDNFNNIPEDSTSNFNTNDRLRENPIMPQVSKNTVGFDTTDSILPPIPISANLSNTNGTDVNQTTPTLQRTNTATDSRKYLIHNNLDTNYKVEITPNRKRREPIVNSITPNQHQNKKRKSFYQQKYDSSPFEIEPPKLNSDVQFSPVKPRRTPLRHDTEQSSQPTDNDKNLTQRFPHTPHYGAGGNLLRTPGQVSRIAHRYSGNFQPELPKQYPIVNESNLMDDSEDTPNISPPVTLNFATVKNDQNLTKTPARQAAQIIVKDILNNVSGINDSGLSGAGDFDSKTTTDNNDNKTILDDDFDAYLDKAKGSPSKDNEDWSE